MGDWGRARRRRGLALLARGLLLCWALLQAEGKLAAKKQPAAGSNIVVLITDDQDALLGEHFHLPKISQLIGAEGINCSNYVLNFALCCPSRATLLTGLCAHKTGIVSLYYPLGGARRFRERGLENKTVAVALQRAGYRTGLVGKYNNGYGQEFEAWHIPPGWEEWLGMRTQGYYNWSASDQGINREYGSAPEDYSTDVITRRAVKFIEGAAADPRPFFLYVAPFAPHTPFVPAPRHVDTVSPDLQVPRVLSWNESDASLRKKIPRTLSNTSHYNPPMSEAEAQAWDHDYRRRAEMMLAVDEQVEALVEALKKVGRLDNTYIFVTSDNGYKLGHRRKIGKQSPYEEDARVPLLVRGPGVPRGVRLPHLITNTDLLPTILELAGVPDPLAAERDGKSFAPLLLDPAARAAPDAFRTGIHLEMLLEKMGETVVTVPPTPPGGGNRSQTAQPNARRRLGAGDLAGQGQGWPPLYNPPGWQYSVGTSLLLVDDLEGAPGQGSARDWDLYGALAAGSGVRAPRRRRLIEDWPPGGIPLIILRFDFVAPYYALRTQSSAGRFKFIEYHEGPHFQGGRELYDLDADPWEVDNIYATAPQALKDYLQRTLDRLKHCSGQGCWVVDAEGLAAASGRRLGASAFEASRRETTPAPASGRLLLLPLLGAAAAAAACWALLRYGAGWGAGAAAQRPQRVPIEDPAFR